LALRLRHIDQAAEEVHHGFVWDCGQLQLIRALVASLFALPAGEKGVTLAGQPLDLGLLPFDLGNCPGCCVNQACITPQDRAEVGVYSFLMANEFISL
jgi:hypothetical protein